MSYSIEKPSNVFQQHRPEDLCIIDVRTAAEVRATSLPGALHLPLQEITAEAVKQAIQQQGKNPQKLYILCRTGQRSEIAAKQLDGQIEQSIVVVEGGIPAVEKIQPDWVLTQGTAVSLERQVRIAAGSLILIGVILGFAVHSAWFALSGFVGAGLLFSGITDSCAMAMMLARMPWNK